MSGKSFIAFACGANLLWTPNLLKGATRMEIISADVHGKIFDETADGYGRGEGTATVYPKRFDAALRDGDPVDALSARRDQTMTVKRRKTLLRASFAAEGCLADLAMPNIRVQARIKSIKIFPGRCEYTLQCLETTHEAEAVESVAYCVGRSGTSANATEKSRDHYVTILQTPSTNDRFLRMSRFHTW